MQALETSDTAPARSRFRRRSRSSPVAAAGGGSSRKRTILLLFATGAVLGIGVTWESHTSRIQARALSRIAERATYAVEPGASRSIAFPRFGPYDERLGYTRLSGYVRRLTTEGYEVESQARFSPTLFDLAALGVYPIYREKSQAGLEIVDGTGTRMFKAAYPARAFDSFDDVPRVVVESILYVENRELLQPGDPRRNPAVEWSRLVKAAFSYGMEIVDPGRAVPGGSTLATQMEKFRHSPGGVTMSPADKLLQMVTASLRSYRYGEMTARARQEIVVDYLNSIAFAARPGYGEVIGLPMALALWYGVDPDETLRLLSETTPSYADLGAKALAYRQVLSLLLAARRPTFYLIENPQALRERTDGYLKILAEEGIISTRVRDEALSITVAPGGKPFVPEEIVAGDRGAARSIRNRLSQMIGARSFYELDRLDLSVDSSVNEERRAAVTRVLESIKQPETAVSLGLTGERLLAAEGRGADKVVYSFTLYEAGEDMNRLRIHADTLGSALDVNDAVMLDLGSTAKLRTLVTYLEVFSELQLRLSKLSAEELAKIVVHRSDAMTYWAVDRVRRYPSEPLVEFLDASMQREYSGSPHETFFTGGGIHRFNNFNKDDDYKRFTVGTAFRHSVNLVFIRMMRDVVNYHMFGGAGSAADVLENPKHWLRPHYISRFAERESRQFLSVFYRRYSGKTPEQIVERFSADPRLTPRRFTVLLRVVRPDLDKTGVVVEVMRRFEKIPRWALTEKLANEIYDTANPNRYELNDLGYLTRTHPLEIWAASYLARNPDASLDRAYTDSNDARRMAYRWLLKPRRPEVQTKRIRQELEIDAFKAIHARWRNLGYPFKTLVPSYATAIGSSADRPDALAALLGIIANGGMHRPGVRVEKLRFAEGTPYETVVAKRNDLSRRVLRADVVSVVRKAMQDVVENGTARRVFHSVVGPDGVPLVLAGKTGTGDHVRKTVNAQGVVLSEEAVSRTATFAFILGDRFYGVIGAFVKGPESADYEFTSALATQVFKVLAPELNALVAGVTGEPAAPAPSVLSGSLPAPPLS